MIICEKIFAHTLQNDATIFQNISTIGYFKGMKNILLNKQDSYALIAKSLDKCEDLTHHYRASP